MALPLLPEAESDFVCACEEYLSELNVVSSDLQLRSDSPCAAEPFYKEHEGKLYCVLHFPGEKSGFWDVLQRKLNSKDLDFRGVWFPSCPPFQHIQFEGDANFVGAHFNGEVDFIGAVFEGNADFSRTTFNGAAYFSDVTFKSASFSGATFRSISRFIRAVFAAAVNFENSEFLAGASFVKAIFDQGANFQGATFSYETPFNSIIPFDCANFSGATFRGRLEFDVAKFNGLARFNETSFNGIVDFGNSIFGGLADFRSSTFDGLNFMHSVFTSDADFRYTTLRGLAQFSDASFAAELDFSEATLDAKLYFSDVTFGTYARFGGKPGLSKGSSLDLQFARIEKPDHLSFHTLTLRPHWFINIDSRRFEFINVDWNWRNTSIKQEIEGLRVLRGFDEQKSYRLLCIACRHLAVNAEESHRYEEASKFRYMAMEARRLEGSGGFVPWRLSWWYWLASGYGERVLKAFLVLLSIWFVAGLLYTRVGFARWEPRLASESDVAIAQRDVVGAPLKFSRALTYSAAVMTFQRPEPRPATTAAQTVVLLQTIIGPVQAALLALAIRRKFMR